MSGTRCHSAHPSYEVFASAPLGVLLDTPEQIQTMAPKIKYRVYDVGNMPFNNKTEMTDFEATLGVYDAPGWADKAQAILDRWIAEGTLVTSTCLPHANVITDGTEQIIFPRTNS